MGFIPDDWKTAAYDHTVAERRVGLFGRIKMHTCTCGMSSMNGLNDLFQQHYNAELDYILWWNTMQRKQSKRSGPFWQ